MPNYKGWACTHEMWRFLKNRKRKRKPGYVYIIWSPMANLFKVGQSKNPKRRIRELKTAIPGGLEVTHIIPTDDMDATERFLHEEANHIRVDGEWFDYMRNADLHPDPLGDWIPDLVKIDYWKTDEVIEALSWIDDDIEYMRIHNIR